MQPDDPRELPTREGAPVSMSTVASEHGGSLIGRVIAKRFAIEALVGEGAMGAVYRARQIALDTTVALKVLHRPYVRDPAFAARFLNEAQAASRIDHPNSMRVIDFGEEPDGLLFLVMEYLDGRTLDRVLAEEGTLPPARIVDIASQILAALAVAHEMGVVHRDLKPENIVLFDGLDDEGNRHDVVKVCDFGVAKLIEPRDAAKVTGDGIIIGTPAYMSPEQARGHELDGRSDLYAMGVLLFQLMTGDVPFEGPTPMGTALMHVTDEPTRPHVLNPSVDDRLEAICMKAMRKRKEDRYQSARELRAELRALLHDVSMPRTTAPLLAQVAPARRHGRSHVFVMASAMLGVVAFGGWLFAHRQEPVGPVAAAPPVMTASPRVSTPTPLPEAPAVEPPTSAPAAPTPAADPVKEPLRAAARAKGKATRHAPVKHVAHAAHASGTAAKVAGASSATPTPTLMLTPTTAKPDRRESAVPPADLPLPVFKETPLPIDAPVERAVDPSKDTVTASAKAPVTHPAEPKAPSAPPEGDALPRLPAE